MADADPHVTTHGSPAHLRIPFPRSVTSVPCPAAPLAYRRLSSHPLAVRPSEGETLPASTCASTTSSLGPGHEDHRRPSQARLRRPGLAVERTFLRSTVRSPMPYSYIDSSSKSVAGARPLPRRCVGDWQLTSSSREQSAGQHDPRLRTARGRPTTEASTARHRQRPARPQARCSRRHRSSLRGCPRSWVRLRSTTTQDAGRDGAAATRGGPGRPSTLCVQRSSRPVPDSTVRPSLVGGLGGPEPGTSPSRTVTYKSQIHRRGGPGQSDLEASRRSRASRTGGRPRRLPEAAIIQGSNP